MSACWVLFGALLSFCSSAYLTVKMRTCCLHKADGDVSGTFSAGAGCRLVFLAQLCNIFTVNNSKSLSLPINGLHVIHYYFLSFFFYRGYFGLVGDQTYQSSLRFTVITTVKIHFSQPLCSGPLRFVTFLLLRSSAFSPQVLSSLSERFSYKYFLIVLNHF